MQKKPGENRGAVCGKNTRTHFTCHTFTLKKRGRGERLFTNVPFLRLFRPLVAREIKTINQIINE